MLVLCMLAGVCFAQTKAKHLILKDGSYQMAREWQVKDDRVRYFSSERFEWEELPGALVDWAATDQYTKEQEAEKAKSSEAGQIEEAQEDRPVFAVPGLRLPDNGGVMLLDVVAGKPQLIEIPQNGSELNKQTGKNILRSMISIVPAGVKQSLELKGKQARTRAHTAVPAFFINVNYDDSSMSSVTGAIASGGDIILKEEAMPREARFHLIRLQSKSDRRVVSDLRISLTGQVDEKQKAVPVSVEVVNSDWVKLTPLGPLQPGEYAVVELLSPTQMNSFVWDFGVEATDGQANGIKKENLRAKS